ncbi:hypothetical protein FK85_29255 [Halorubrum saccharovorum]|uniref:DUF8173 domain-containing protein n=1 Tax=Halorubrum saccharovorum TaxID=2248 RepID=A0A0F8AUP5_9EURY|nr:hypothetical protein [Halorubrum saccharovorum]KKF39341.1 hypothetical protein FK85_29255 [Halorubrum saccharovorum]
MVPPQAASLLSRIVAAIGPAIDSPPQWTGVELLGSAAVSFVTTAVGITLVGVIVSAVSPNFTDDGVEYLHAEPGEAFVYGVVAYVAIAVAMFLLAITVIGLIVVVPAVIVLAVLSFGGTAVSAIALGTWIRSALGMGAADGRGADIVVGAVAWAGLGLVPVLGGLARFVVGAMGFGYLALWIANGQFDRDYGSVNAGRYGGTGGSTGPDSLGENDEGDADREGVDDPDRFRNIAALDAEREAEANERAAEGDASDETGSTGRER